MLQKMNPVLLTNQRRRPARKKAQISSRLLKRENRVLLFSSSPRSGTNNKTASGVYDPRDSRFRVGYSSRQGHVLSLCTER